MRHSNHTLIRQLLREAPDGLNVEQIAQRGEATPDAIRAGLRSMPDAYIDRWVERYHRPPHSVWCVVVPPENCPKPKPKGKTNERTEIPSE